MIVMVTAIYSTVSLPPIDHENYRYGYDWSRKRNKRNWQS